MLKTFLSVKFIWNPHRHSPQSVDSPKAIMKLTIVGISDSSLSSKSSIIFCVGSILYLVEFCCSQFCLDSSILRL